MRDSSRERYSHTTIFIGGGVLVWIDSDRHWQYCRGNETSSKKFNNLDYGPRATNISDAELDPHGGSLSVIIDIVNYTHLPQPGVVNLGSACQLQQFAQ